MESEAFQESLVNNFQLDTSLEHIFFGIISVVYTVSGTFFVIRIVHDLR